MIEQYNYMYTLRESAFQVKESWLQMKKYQNQTESFIKTLVNIYLHNIQNSVAVIILV